MCTNISDNRRQSSVGADKSAPVGTEKETRSPPLCVSLAPPAPCGPGAPHLHTRPSPMPKSHGAHPMPSCPTISDTQRQAGSLYLLPSVRVPFSHPLRTDVSNCSQSLPNTALVRHCLALALRQPPTLIAHGLAMHSQCTASAQLHGLACNLGRRRGQGMGGSCEVLRRVGHLERRRS